MLKTVGLGGWIAATPDEYVARADEPATDRDQLAHHHRTLRDRIERSPLCDAAGFARRFETVLERILA